MAQRALARLLVDDPRNTWRHMVTIALEDLGVAGIDVLARVVAAARNRPWRRNHGGEWAVASSLVAQMAESQGCQAACDLLLRATNDPSLASARFAALEADQMELIALLRDEQISIERKAVVALALGGGLAEEQRFHDSAPVFAALGDGRYSSHVMATCEAAWRISRNEMAFLLPLLWPSWMQVEPAPVRDDDIPPMTLIGEVPDYALDQFTRVGLAAFKQIIRRSPELQTYLAGTGLGAGKWPRIVGDLVFLVSGSPMRQRAIWPLGDQLRLPVRSMPHLRINPAMIAEGMDIIEAQGRLITDCRAASLTTLSPQSPAQGVYGLR